MNGMAILRRNWRQRFDAAFHGGPRAFVRGGGKSVAVT